MDKKTVGLLGELAQYAAHAAELLTASEIALGEGELLLCQQNVKEAQQLLSTLLTDVFREAQEAFGFSEAKSGALPGNLELARALDHLAYTACLYQGVLLEDDGERPSMRAKVADAVGVVVGLYRDLYLN